MEVLGWDKIFALPAAIIVLGVILYFIFRALPTWKDVKLAEIKVRESEAESRTNEASAFGKLSDVLNAMIVDQQRDARNAHVLQRVNAAASDKILSRLDTLDELAVGHIQITEQLGNVMEIVNTSRERINRIENSKAAKE